MPKARYENIYRDLKEKIETNTFAYQEFLPPEHTLVQIYGCSRNTLRRAVGLLVTDGYVQTLQGKGVRNITSRRNRPPLLSVKSRASGNLRRETATHRSQRFFFLLN